MHSRTFSKNILDENKKQKREERKEQKKFNSKLFFGLLKTINVPEPATEVKFHPTRQWRFDYAWVDKKIALEVEGGVFIRGAHNRPTHFMSDMEKYNQATLLGWRLIRTTPTELLSKQNIELINQIYKQ